MFVALFTFHSPRLRRILLLLTRSCFTSAPKMSYCRVDKTCAREQVSAPTEVSRSIIIGGSATALRAAGAFWLRSSGACFCSTMWHIQQYIFRLEKYVIDASKKGFIYWGKHHPLRWSLRLLARVIWRMLSQVTICILPYCICIWNYVLLFIFVFVLVLYLLVLGCSSSGHCFRLNSQITFVGLIFWFGLFVGTAIGCLGLLCQFHIIYLRHTSTFQIYFFLLWSTLHICKIISSYAVTIFDLMVKKYALTAMSQNRPF